MPDYDTLSSEEDDDTTGLGLEVIYLAVPFFEREKGPKHRRLTSFKPSKQSFGRLVSYWYYRSSRTSRDRDSFSTG